MEEGKRAGGESHEMGSMPLTGHLKELRNRIFVCLGFFFAAFLLGMNRAPAFVQFLLKMGEENKYRFIYISPQELLLEYVSVAVVFAVILSLPVLLYEIWAFLCPGLTPTERVMILLAMVFGLLFAFLGILFAYKVLLPFMLYFLYSLGAESGIEASVSVQNYISFLMTIFIIFAVIFELPVVTVTLTRLGILKVDWMKRFRKFVIILIFFIAAIITPPDVVSQVMVAVPMVLLYEMSIVLCVFVDKFAQP